jgi:hypothetical protein
MDTQVVVVVVEDLGWISRRSGKEINMEMEMGVPHLPLLLSAIQAGRLR